MNQKIVHRVERIRRSRFALGVSLLVGLPLLAAVPASGPSEWLLGGVSAVGAGASVWAIWRRRVVARLPLVASGVALLDDAGAKAIWLRVWLGNGRVLRDGRARLRFHGDWGTRSRIARAPSTVLIGPWTLRVEAPQGWNEVEVEFEAVEGSRRWTAVRLWERSSLQVGRFAPPLCVSPKGSFWAPETWSEVVGKSSRSTDRGFSR